MMRNLPVGGRSDRDHERAGPQEVQGRRRHEVSSGNLDLVEGVPRVGRQSAIVRNLQDHLHM